MKEMELAHFMMITHAGHKGHCKKICILLFSNKNELVEMGTEFTDQNICGADSGVTGRYQR